MSAVRGISRVEGRAVPVLGDELDTDRIIPARFLKLLTFRDLGQYAFFDARFDELGASLGHPLDDPRFAGATVLLSGRNFGCGSSREHAPQSLYRAGFRAVVAESFAEIFFGNALALGLVCVSLARPDLERLAGRVEAEPELRVAIDLEARRLVAESAAGTETFELAVPEAAREALLEGQFDPLALLRLRPEAVRAVHDRLPYTRW
jgi:3-isopropylmalate/(R)-2-methylmalate dehydratase small subunit